MSLELKNISMSVNGATHIYNTDLILEKGTMNVLLGRTQSGKTTLMRIMAGLDVPTTGKVFWNGKDVTKARVQDRKVAMVYQQFINYPTLSVYENIASPLKIMKMPKLEIDEKVRKTAELLHLTNELEKKPLELSGGQQQRCALARALVKNSGLVLLDEPLANLDYKLREELREEIPKIFKESGAIFVYATTEPEEALLLGGNVITMWEGNITQHGKSLEVYHFPNSSTTAIIFSNPSMNFFDFTKKGEYIFFGNEEKTLATNTLADLKDGNYVAGFRPNYLDIKKYSDNAMKIQTHLEVTEITGSETYMHLTYMGIHWIGLIEGVKNLKFDSNIDVYLDTRHIYVFSTDGKVVTSARSSIENYKQEL